MTQSQADLGFKASVVKLILDGRAEKALELLAKHYNVNSPKIRVGLPRSRRRKTSGCYTPKNGTISVLDSDTLKEPAVVLHEFYHHLRTSHVDKRHKGTERLAAEFAAEFVKAYQYLRP